MPKLIFLNLRSLAESLHSSSDWNVGASEGGQIAHFRSVQSGFGFVRRISVIWIHMSLLYEPYKLYELYKPRSRIRVMIYTINTATILG